MLLLKVCALQSRTRSCRRISPRPALVPALYGALAIASSNLHTEPKSGIGMLQVAVSLAFYVRSILVPLQAILNKHLFARHRHVNRRRARRARDMWSMSLETPIAVAALMLLVQQNRATQNKMPTNCSQPPRMMVLIA